MLYNEMTKAELLKLREELMSAYEEKKGLGLDLSMARGKPSKEQLELSMHLLDVLNNDTKFVGEDKMDIRNYGILPGIKEARKFFANILEVKPENIVLYGSASLTLMYDTISRAYIKGVLGSTPWSKLDKVKFLCPVPGYDRHFTVCEFFGIEMINVPMNEDGPDMDMVEKLVSEDPAIKGIWCVPKYSNPDGYVYSDEVVKRFASLKPAAEDFRIYWDNAYIIHHLYPEKPAQILNIIEECAKAGNPDMVYEFCSTSKVTFPGAGISAMASSEKNIKSIISMMDAQIISHDKMNQLRHVLFFPTMEKLEAHMAKHADIMRPKFEAVIKMLNDELGGLGIAEWTNPTGGYFIGFNSLPGCAKKIVSMCADAGVVMTGAGATYPYGKDPEDKNIRIAPSFPTIDELIEACKIFVICVKIASIDKLVESI